MIGIPIAVVVLIFVFGALVAPGLPLVLAIFSIGIALGIVTLIGQFEELQLFIENMVTMLGLAIGIDYTLFIVERYREQRQLGYEKQRSIEIAGATSGKAVLFSGMTVILALIGVMLVPINIFFSLGLGAVIVVSVAVALTLTLLPAMLSLLGDRINWPRRTAPASISTKEDDVYSGFWGTATRLVVGRPVLSMAIAVVLLTALALPVLDLRTGFTGTAQMPPGEITEAYRVLERDFSAGVLGPVEFVFQREHTEEADAALDALRTELETTGEFAPFSQPVRWDEEQQIAVIEGTMIYPPSSEAAYQLIREVRSEIIPTTVGDVDGLEAWVTGQSAFEIDMLDMLENQTPLVFIFVFVLALSFVLLALAFRSLVVPLQAIVFNLLSVGATWGIMVMVFSKGVLRDLFGFHVSPVIESWIPILLFCILFGLSMDYHVFILSRIREHYDISHDNRESVAVSLRSTGIIITGAALIMVVVFGAFATGSMLALQQLGFGLAVAVLLDATIVRSVLVPSAMMLLGDRNWWLPGWLGWLPDLRIEGEPQLPSGAQHSPVPGD
jgi:RND superfamily putative drug exporter